MASLPVHPDLVERGAALGIRLTPLTPTIGAEIAGLNLSRVHVRFRWSPNAIAIWDNRSTQHYPIGDYWPASREVERATVAGDIVER